MADRRPRRVERRDGYLPIEDYGLIGDGATGALVGRDGSIDWLCIPRFDGQPLFCGLLDSRRGGSFRVAPTELRAARQRYETDTGVLVTELYATGGVVEITDALTLRSGADLSEDLPAARGELVRAVRILDGDVTLHVEVTPFPTATPRTWADGIALDWPAAPEMRLQLLASRWLDGLRSEHRLHAGDTLDLVLRWSGSGHAARTAPAAELLTATADAWRRWIKAVAYAGINEAAVRRSVITLKLLDHLENGAIVAAPTSSLPERVGGQRNWDYRYAWVRDAAFSVYALRRVGLTGEARGFLGWVLDTVGRSGAARVLYDLDGGLPPPEHEDGRLEGYRGSAPVRWGNAAADQTQHDAYGEILDCAYQWAAQGGDIDRPLWDQLRPLVEEARRRWRQPDHGIWEVRTPARPFTYSAAMCLVALDRGARVAARLGLPGDAHGWQADAARISGAIRDDAWNDDRGAIVEHLDGTGGLDASLLALPLRRVIRADDPKMVATSQAIADRLHAGGGLLYRYLPAESPDGVPGDENAFLLCSFWLADNLAYQGRLDAAVELFSSLCSRSNHLGLLPEQIDPSTGAFCGNYPQGLSHVGLISTAINLNRQFARREA